MIESGLPCLVLARMLDLQRADVRPMIEVWHTAGIRVVMITSGKRLTAESAARKIGISTDAEGVAHKLFTGASSMRCPR